MAGKLSGKFVVDSSFILSFLLPDESNSIVEDIFDNYLDGKAAFYSPYLLPFEVFNGLDIAVLRKRLSPRLAEELGEKFLLINIKLESVDFPKILKLAISRNLTVYDASYLYLSQTQGFELLTLDTKLKSLA